MLCQKTKYTAKEKSKLVVEKRIARSTRAKTSFRYTLVVTERKKASVLNTTAKTRVVIRYVSAAKATPLSCSTKTSTAGI